jgi:hypothetical protein
MGGLLGGRSPPSQKIGFFKAEGLISGWVGKIRKINSFRITKQGNKLLL